MPNKKTIVFFFYCLVQTQLLLAQSNMVIDGSFEELKTPLNNSTCIDFSDIVKWRVPNNNNTRYYNTQSTDENCSPDYNQIYYQIPKDSNGIIGLYVVNANNVNFADITRSYIQGSLSEPLKVNKRYEVKFYVSLANYTGMSVSTIGALFTTDAITFTNRCELEPQVESHQHLTDTLNWMEIKGEFIAQGGEQYITIGNFRTDAESDTLKVLTHSEGSTTARVGFYTLDNVSVICLDCTVGVEEQNQAQNNVFYNTSSNTLNVSERGELLIYNMLGDVVLQQNTQQDKTISVQYLPPGVYVWQLQTEQSTQQGKFVVSEW